MIPIRPVRHRAPRSRASLFTTASGTVAAAGLVLAALTPGAMAAGVPAAPGSTQSPAVEAPAGYPAVPDRLLSRSADAVDMLAPSNDNFSSAQVITGYSGDAFGDNLGASAEEGEPALPGIDDGGAYHSVWYSWTAPAAGAVVLDVCSSPPGSAQAPYDSKMGAYTGSQVFNLTNVASNDDDCGSSSRISFTAVSGTTYAITVDGYGGSTGHFYLQWNLEAAAQTISIDDATKAEGNGGDPTYFNFKISVPDPAGPNVTVHWETVDGTATSPDDYASASGTVTIPEGGTSNTVSVEVAGDVVFEADETFSVLLSSPEGAVIGDASGTGTIENDDAGADLIVYLDKFGGKVRVGGYLSYFVQVFNPAGGDTAAVSITDVLPPNVTYDSYFASQGSCTGSSTIECSFGDIPGGGSAYVAIYAVPDRTGVYQNTVTMTSSIHDPNPENNTATVKTTVIADKSGCTMIGTYEDDSITGTTADDVICTYGGDDTVNAGDGNDTVRSGSGYDTVRGGNGFDQLIGAAGRDQLFGGAEPDVIDGGTGRDTVSYADDPGLVNVNLLTGIGYDGYGFPPPLQRPSYDTLISVGDVIGSQYGDVLVGGDDLNNLYGLGGDDTIQGMASRDLLDGGPGTDNLDGGTKNDTCLNGEVLTSCEF